MNHLYKLEKQNELTERVLVANTDSRACEEDDSVEDNEIEAKLKEEQEEASIGQCEGSSKDPHRFTGCERSLRKSEAPTFDKMSFH
jgi:hypothetical protein